jgi:hypothetical protein
MLSAAIKMTHAVRIARSSLELETRSALLDRANAKLTVFVMELDQIVPQGKMSLMAMPVFSLIMLPQLSRVSFLIIPFL